MPCSAGLRRSGFSIRKRARRCRQRQRTTMPLSLCADDAEATRPLGAAAPRLIAVFLADRRFLSPPAPRQRAMMMILRAYDASLTPQRHFMPPLAPFHVDQRRHDATVALDTGRRAVKYHISFATPILYESSATTPPLQCYQAASSQLKLWPASISFCQPQLRRPRRAILQRSR